MEIEVKDYLSESEIKEIVQQELRLKVRQQFDLNNIERIFSNSAYHIVWEEVNKSIDYDVTEFIKNKVPSWKISPRGEPLCFKMTGPTVV